MTPCKLCLFSASQDTYEWLRPVMNAYIIEVNFNCVCTNIDSCRQNWTSDSVQHALYSLFPGLFYDAFPNKSV
jgi:disulfide oxidoreductase YuzD